MNGEEVGEQGLRDKTKSSGKSRLKELSGVGAEKHMIMQNITCVPRASRWRGEKRQGGIRGEELRSLRASNSYGRLQEETSRKWPRVLKCVAGTHPTLLLSSKGKQILQSVLAI